MACPLVVLSDAEWVANLLLLEFLSLPATRGVRPSPRIGAAPRIFAIEQPLGRTSGVSGVGEEACWLPGFKLSRQVRACLGSSSDAWTHSTGVEPNDQRSIVQRVCFNDMRRGCSSPTDK
jgi:hypothetical protein